MAATHLNLGNLLKKGTRLQEAESEYRDALAIFRPLASDFPSLFEYQADLATTLDVLALLARDRKDYPVARRLLEEARRHVQRALDSNPRRPLYRLIFCNIQRDLAATLLDVGEYAAAAETAGELSRIAFEPAGDAYQAACFFSRCVVLAETDNRLPQAQRQELAKTHGDRAVAALREAVAKGYADVANVRKEKDLDPLRPRPDFQKLIAELEKAAAQDKSKDKQPAK